MRRTGNAGPTAGRPAAQSRKARIKGKRAEGLADAILADTTEGAAAWFEVNAKYAGIWPVITEAREPLPEAEEWNGTPGKLRYLSENPAEAA